MTTKRHDGTRTGRRQWTDSSRYQQLQALANEGNEDAAGDLFREFGVQAQGSTREAEKEGIKGGQLNGTGEVAS